MAQKDGLSIGLAVSVDSDVYLFLVRSVSSYILSTVPCFLSQANVAQWLQKALDREVADWSREQEPNTDPSGFYYSPMPAIVLQVSGKVGRQASSPHRKGGRGQDYRGFADGCLSLPIDPSREHSCDQPGQ